MTVRPTFATTVRLTQEAHNALEYLAARAGRSTNAIITQLVLRKVAQIKALEEELAAVEQEGNGA